MKLLDDQIAATEAVHEYFGYQEDWVVIPLADGRNYYWYLTGEGRGDRVCYADTEEELAGQTGNYYEEDIFAQCHLEKWVYRQPDYTMVVTDPNTDGNHFLTVFDNAKERQPGPSRGRSHGWIGGEMPIVAAVSEMNDGEQNQAALQAAIDAAIAAGGGTVLIKAGTYPISESCEGRGDGRDARSALAMASRVATPPARA